MFGELMSIVGAANMTNRLATGYQVPVDEKFKEPTATPSHAATLPKKRSESK
jgi:hypothetical protein